MLTEHEALPYPADSEHYPLLELIQTPVKKMLDIGCYCGGMRRWLKKKFPDCKMIGIELSPLAAEKAAMDYDEVLVGSVETLEFPEHFSQFDAILAADVLEHLYNPWQLLKRLHPLLSHSGALYVNLPNVRNLTNLALLADTGEWRYQRSGILDITHVRFFTRQSALEMLENTGWQAEEIQFIPDVNFEQQIQDMDIEEIKRVDIGRFHLEALNSLDVLELLSVQFAIRAVPKPAET